MPATLQATIAARIDRLGRRPNTRLRRGGHRVSLRSRSADRPGVDPSVDELIAAELVDQVRFTPRAEYAFRHPLIRTVAYESQLKSDRARLHRRLAAAIEVRDRNRPTRTPR